MPFNPKYILFGIMLFCFSLNMEAQYVFEWNNYYDNHSIEHVTSLTKGSDNNIYILGLSKDSIDAIWLVKINQNGQQLWSKHITGYQSILAGKIIQTKDKNLLLTATISEKDTAKRRIWIAKIDNNGNLLWERLYAGAGIAFVSDIVQTYDSGYAIAGYTCVDNMSESDWYILKLDSIGYFQWDKIFGSHYDDRALGIAQMLDSSIIAVGYLSYSYGGFKKGSMTKLSLDGAYISGQDLAFGTWSTINTISATSDSNFIIAAEIRYQPLLDFNTKVIKMTQNFDTIWTQKVDAPIMEHPVSIIETYDQGYALAYTWKADGVGNVNVAAVKFSPNGNIIWQKVFYRKSDDYSSQMIETPDNSLMIGASTYSLDKAWNFGVVKFRSIESSDMKFIVPYQFTLTYYKHELPINAYIVGYKKPKEVKIYNNRLINDTLIDFKIDEKKTNTYLFNYEVTLKPGVNNIDFIVTDYKDYKFVRSLRVYYIPEPLPHW